MRFIYCGFLAIVCLSLVAGDAKLDIAKIEQITGLKGTWNEQEGVFKITSPRNDVKVSVDHFVMPPFMGLTTWAGFVSGTKAEAMVMGDLVVFQDEVNSVMSALLDNGVSVTALHNHFFFDEPKVYFMHIGGDGSLEVLATGVRKALDRIKEIRAENPAPASNFGGEQIPANSSLNAATLDGIFNIKGQTKDGMYKCVFGRKVKMPCGCDAGKEMGVNTWAAFAGSDENAIVDGDFAVIEEELQTVLKALRKENINVVTIHHHMISESPRTIFLHYWGKGKSAALANGVKNALGSIGK